MQVKLSLRGNENLRQVWWHASLLTLLFAITVSVPSVIAQESPAPAVTIGDTATIPAIAQTQGYQHAGQFAEGQALLEAVLAQATALERPRLHAALADLHRAWSDDLKKRYAYEDAITHYEVAFTLDQSERRQEAVAALVSIGEAYRELNHYDTARAYYEWALTLQRERGDRANEGVTLSRLGQVYGDVDQNEKAIEVLEQALLLLRAAHDRREEGQALSHLGTAYLDLSQYDRAQEYYEQALAIAKEIGNRKDEAAALMHFGAVYRLRGEFSSSLTYLKQALAVFREIHDRKSEGQALNQLVIVFSTTNPPAAVEYYEQALPIAREVHDRDLESSLLGNLGGAYHRLGQYDKAIEYLTLALTIDRELNKRYGEGAELNSLGQVYQSLGQYDRAITYFEQALVIMQELKDRASEGTVLHSLGSIYKDLSQYDKAITYYQQALSIDRETKNRDGEASVLNSLALAYLSLSQYDKALEQFGQALLMMRESGNRPGEGRILNNLAATYRHLGRSEQAIPYLEQALAIAREVQDRHGESTTLDNLATAYTTLSQYAKAIECNQHSLTITREIKDKSGEGRALANLGALYFTLGQYEQARQHLEQALVILRETKARDPEGTVLYSLGSVHKTLQQYDKAREYYEQALTIAQEIHDRDGEVLRLSGLGSVYGLLGQHEKAIALQEQALTLAREIKDRRAEGIILNNLGVRQSKVGEYEKAFPYYEQALVILREIGDRDQEAGTLDNIMMTWRARGTPQLAIFYGKQAVNTYQEIRGRIHSLTSDLQESFLQSKEETYRTLADLLISEGRLPEAEEVLRLLKQEELFEFVRRDAKATDALARLALTKTEEQWSQRYLAIAEQVSKVGAEYGALRVKKNPTDEEKKRLDALEAELQAIRQAFTAFLDTLKTDVQAAHVGSDEVVSATNAKSFQATLRQLEPGTVALYTVVGKEKLWVMLVTPDIYKAYETPISIADLNRKVLALRQALQNPKLNPRPLAQDLYSLLLGPVEADLQTANAQTLMWSLDGMLRYVPLAALYDGQRYLIERYRLSVFTLQGRDALREVPSRAWRAAGLGVSKAQAGFDALTYVPEEIGAIIRSKARGGVLPGVTALDERFTSSRFAAVLREAYPVIHIASHFQFQPGTETESFLLLGEGQRLSIAQLKGYDFAGVELLTLSACNTAFGSTSDGKEVESFAMLAQESGARAVLASLWPVADASTKELMQLFYRIRESKKGMSKAEALQQAQLALLQGTHKKGEPDTTRGVVEVRHDLSKANDDNTAAPQFVKDVAVPYAHPYYWAPFILIGNWR